MLPTMDRGYGTLWPRWPRSPSCYSQTAVLIWLILTSCSSSFLCACKVSIPVGDRPSRQLWLCYESPTKHCNASSMTTIIRRGVDSFDDSSCDNEWSWASCSKEITFGEKEKERYGTWLRKINIAGKARCLLCNMEISYGWHGVTALMDHLKTSKHHSAFRTRTANNSIAVLGSSPDRFVPVTAVDSLTPLTAPMTTQEVMKMASQNEVKTGTKCGFCRTNGETPEFYSTHMLKDCWGRVICPVLRNYVCPNCGTSGDSAHTLRYCPYMKGIPKCTDRV